MNIDRSAARFTFEALVAAEKAHAAAAALFVSMYAPAAEWDAKVAKVAEALAALRAEEAKVAGLLCAKCDGKGRILGYSHRSNGLCYRCNGDGWTAKGREAYRQKETQA